MASRRPGVSGLETPYKAPNLSRCSRGRRALRGRLDPSMSTPVPTKGRGLRKNGTESWTATAVGLPDSTGSELATPPSPVPQFSDGPKSSSDIVSTADTSPYSSGSDEEVEVMRNADAREDQRDTVTDGGASCSSLIPRRSGSVGASGVESAGRDAVFSCDTWQ